jgi:hypothetical protein
MTNHLLRHSCKGPALADCRAFSGSHRNSFAGSRFVRKMCCLGGTATTGVARSRRTCGFKEKT